MDVSFVNQSLVVADKVVDYIPIVSTVSNITDLFQKLFFIPMMNTEKVAQNHYYRHLKDKSIRRCIALLVPVFGNIIVMIHDITSRFKPQQTVETNQNEAKKTNPAAGIGEQNPFDLSLSVDEGLEMIFNISDGNLEKHITHFVVHNKQQDRQAQSGFYSVIRKLTTLPDESIRKPKTLTLMKCYVKCLNEASAGNDNFTLKHVNILIENRGGQGFSLTNLIVDLSGDRELQQVIINCIDRGFYFEGYLKQISKNDDLSLRLLVDNLLANYAPRVQIPALQNVNLMDSVCRVKRLVDHWGMDRVVKVIFKDQSDKNGWIAQTFLAIPRDIHGDPLTDEVQKAFYMEFLDSVKKLESVGASHLAKLIEYLHTSKYWLQELTPLVKDRDDIQIDIPWINLMDCVCSVSVKIMPSALLQNDLDSIYRKIFKPVVMQIPKFYLEQKNLYLTLLRLYHLDNEVTGRIMSTVEEINRFKALKVLKEKQLKWAISNFPDLFTYENSIDKIRFGILKPVFSKEKLLPMAQSQYLTLIDVCGVGERQDILRQMVKVELDGNYSPPILHAIIHQLDSDSIKKLADDNIMLAKRGRLNTLFRRHVLSYYDITKKDSVLIAAFRSCNDAKQLSSLSTIQKNVLIPHAHPQVQLVLGDKDAIDLLVDIMNTPGFAVGVWPILPKEFITYLKEDLLIEFLSKLTDQQNKTHIHFVSWVTSLLEGKLDDERYRHNVPLHLINKLYRAVLSLTPEQIKFGYKKNSNPRNLGSLLKRMSDAQFEAYLSLKPIASFLPEPSHEVIPFLNSMPTKRIHDVLAKEDPDKFYEHICQLTSSIRSSYRNDVGRVFQDMMESDGAWQLKLFCEKRGAFYIQNIIEDFRTGSRQYGPAITEELEAYLKGFVAPKEPLKARA